MVQNSARVFALQMIFTAFERGLRVSPVAVQQRLCVDFIHETVRSCFTLVFGKSTIFGPSQISSLTSSGSVHASPGACGPGAMNFPWRTLPISTDLPKCFSRKKDSNSYAFIKEPASLELEQVRFDHSEGNSPEHIKSSLDGCSETIILDKSSPVLGTWQGIFVCEFDGPRNSKVNVKITGD
jgi:hypothetical protein